MENIENKQLNVTYVPIASLYHSERNPRKWSKEAVEQLKESIRRHGVVDPLIINSASGREGIIIGGNFRMEVLKELGYEMVPVVEVTISDPEKEAELSIRLNKNTGEFDYDLLAQFDNSFLADIGFSSEELDEIFPTEENPSVFNLEEELAKLDIEAVTIQKGDLYQVGDLRLYCGDSTIEADMLALMGDERADLCLTDPPYILDYLHGKKRNGSATEGFGLRRDRRYLETDVLPDNFTELWMANIHKIQKPDFSIMVFENPKNLRIIWNELEKYWRYRNTITWFLPNRVQGFAGKYKFFNKTDIALVGTSGNVSLNDEPEQEELFQNEYENAIFATSGKPHWEKYERGKKICPTDFIEHIAADEKASGQGIIFGTKPVEILIPYIKVLTKRGDLVVEPFGGSGSTGVACAKLGRRCFTMEKVPTYAEVILTRWERETGKKRTKLYAQG